MKIMCDKCKNEIKSNIKFISFPKILVIILVSKKEKNIKFYYNKKIDIGKYSFRNKKNNNSNYNLISLIRKYEKGFTTFCKASGDNDIWYNYKEAEPIQKVENINTFDNIKTTKDIPYLLIYQQCN